MDELVQVFTILAFLAVGLASITVPTYAISVSYLARETTKTSELIKKRQEELQDKLEKFKLRLKESTETKELKKEIKKYEERIGILKERLSYLSAKGAVGYPLSGFLGAFSLSILGIYYHIAKPYFIASVVFLIIVGLTFLSRALIGIERAALRIISPEFEVEFESGTTVEKFRAEEQKEISFAITNTGEDLAENVRLVILFPPDFDVIKKGDYGIAKQSGRATYPDYNAVLHYVPPPVCIYVDDEVTFKVSLKMPERTGRYEIPIEINARNMRRSKHQLTIEIVSKSGP